MSKSRLIIFFDILKKKKKKYTLLFDGIRVVLFESGNVGK